MKGLFHTTLVLLAVAFPGQALTNAQNWQYPADAASESSYVRAPSVAERYLLAAANKDRALRQLPPLHLDEHLMDAARIHAREMVRHHNISHRFDGEAELAERASEVGAHFSMIAENVAEAPDPAEIHDLWMNSSGHRANLLNPHVDAVGIAVMRAGGEFYAVEDFAHLVDGLSIAQQEMTVSDLLAGQGLRMLRPTEDARETCLRSTGYAGERRPWFVMRYTASGLDRLPDELVRRIATGRYRDAVVGACILPRQNAFTSYSLAVLLYP